MGIISFIVLGLIAGAIAKTVWKATSRAACSAPYW